MNIISGKAMATKPINAVMHWPPYSKYFRYLHPGSPKKHSCSYCPKYSVPVSGSPKASVNPEPGIIKVLFRKMVYDTREEMEKVMGKLSDNSFIREQQKELLAFREKINNLQTQFS